MNRRSIVKPCVFGGLFAVWCGFIFFNSFKNGVESSASSNSIVARVAGVLTSLGVKLDNDLLITIIRKTAHVTEFLVMGLLLCLCFYYGAQRFLSHSGTILFVCLSVGVVDEFIQSFVPGRSSEVKDVLFDFGGAMLAFLIVFFIDYKKRNSGYKKRSYRR